MTSTLKQSMLDLKTQILSDGTFLYAAIFNGQIKRDEQGTMQFPFPKPAVMIEIQSPQSGVQLLGSGVTINDNQVFKFCIVHEQIDAVSDGTISSGMDENLDVFDLRDKLKVLLTGFKPTNCSALQYEGEAQDYEHNMIYVYGMTFKCSYVDTKGSAFDVDSTAWVDGELTELNLNGFLAWVSEKSYVALENAVIQDGKIYLCAVDNSDIDFTVGNWQLITAWAPTVSYTANSSVVALDNHIYGCRVDNNDATFTLSNWGKIF